MSEDGTLGTDVPPTVERTPTVLLLDTSGSMGHQQTDATEDARPKIEQLNDGLEFFKDEIEKKDHAETRVDVAMVSFGADVAVEQDFTPISDWNPQQLSNGGKTPMGEAIEKGIDLVEERKSEYRDNGYAYNRPIIWLLTDGRPTDMTEGDQMWDRVQKQLDKGTGDDHFMFFAFGIGDDADIQTLDEIVSVTDENAYQLDEGMFMEYFRVVSNSLEKESEPGDGGQILPQVEADSS